MSTLLSAAVATLVFCAPGYPGGAGDAQPFVDEFAKNAATSAGWSAGSLSAVYDPSEQGGLAKLKNSDSVLSFVPYAFFVQHGAELRLTPLVQADVLGVGVQERWTLVGKAGSADSGQAFAGFTILTVAGYAPDFVRHYALGVWATPEDVKIETSLQVLSTLRRVANGEKVIALLDQTQSAALPTLPFAAQLKMLSQSRPLPVAIIAVVDARVPPARAKALQAALLKMKAGTAGAGMLGSLRLNGFVLPDVPAPVDKP